MGRTNTISNAEWNIMNRLWEQESSTITILTAELKESTGWTQATVITLLKRLMEKGCVAYREIGRTKHFYAVAHKEDIVREETESLIERAYHGSVGLLVNSLVQQYDMSKEEIEELNQIIKKATKK